MPIDIHQLYTERRSKEWLIERLETHPEDFEASVDTMLHGGHPQGWRAGWIVGHVIKKNDSRLQPRVGEIVAAIPGKTDGHQRELLRMLLKLDIDDDNEGPLFDVCMTLWEDLGKPAAVRYFAIRHIMDIAARYPELKNDLQFIIVDEYVEPLSPGIRKSVRRRLKKIGL